MKVQALPFNRKPIIVQFLEQMPEVGDRGMLYDREVTKQQILIK